MDCFIMYVPTDAAPAVRQAIGDAGAGRLGNYSHCSFSAEGTGRFTPLPGATPAIGAVGSPEEVPETRIEATYPRSRRNAVVAAALAAAPLRDAGVHDLSRRHQPAGGSRHEA